MEAAKGVQPPYKEGDPDTLAPPIFESIYSLCPAGRPLLAYAYTFMRWLYYGMVAEGYYRTEGGLGREARAFVDAHNQWAEWSPVNPNMPYPDAMHSAQNQHAVKSLISDPQTVDTLMAHRGPEFMMEPRPQSDEKEPVEEKAAEPDKISVPPLERSHSPTVGGAFGSGSPSGFITASQSPEPMPDQACELPPGAREQKVPDHIDRNPSAIRLFNEEPDSEDEDIIAVEEDDPEVPGETRTVYRRAERRKPTQKYSNTTFLVFGAILLGLAFMTDER